MKIPQRARPGSESHRHPAKGEPCGPQPQGQPRGRPRPQPTSTAEPEADHGGRTRIDPRVDPRSGADPGDTQEPPWGEAAFFHERIQPGFRQRFREEMTRATQVDVAVTRLRLSTIDLSAEEVRGVKRIRLIVSELRAVELDAEAHALMARRGARLRMARLQQLLDRDIVRVRVAPLAGWSPDFSVFSGPARAHAVLMGFHAFEVPHPYAGPALGAAFGPSQAGEARVRFEEVWARGHDVAPAVQSIFRRARSWMKGPDTGAVGRPKSVDTPLGLG